MTDARDARPGGEADVIFGNASDVGRVRERNEDYYGVFAENGNAEGRPPGRLFVVADGMGGHDRGDVASRLAVESLRDAFRSTDASVEPGLALRLAVEAANDAVYREGERHHAERRMGTTMTALLLRDGQGYVAHVGDSRAYLVRRRAIRQLTQDHSRVAELVRKGVISAAEAETHPESSTILRAVGLEARVEVDVDGPLPLRSGDAVVLCTDGLTRLVSPEEIRRSCQALPPQQACERLVALANERGAPDNITVQVIRLRTRRRARWMAAAASGVIVVALAGGAHWWRATPASPRPTDVASAVPVAAAPPPVPAIPAPAQQLRPVGRLERAQILAVNREGTILALAGTSAVVGTAAGEGRVSFVTLSIGEADLADPAWRQIGFAADGAPYGVLEEGGGAAGVAVVPIDLARRSVGRPSLRLAHQATERTGILAFLARVFQRGRPVAPPTVQLESPGGASVTPGPAGVVYLRLADRLLRVEGATTSVLTARGFVPGGQLHEVPLEVAAIAPAGAGDLTVARSEGVDLLIDTVRGGRLDPVMRVVAGVPEVLRGVALLPEGRIALVLGDRLRIVERTGTEIRTTELVPSARPVTPEGSAVLALTVRLRSGPRSVERPLLASEGWHLGAPPRTAEREAARSGTFPAGLSPDGAWWVFALGDQVYRVHLADSAREIARGWTELFPEAPRGAAPGRRG